MSRVSVNWVKCNNGQWCSLEGLNLNAPAVANAAGVYLIFYQGRPGRVVRVGQGNIAERLASHRRDREILAYKDKGLLVTWCSLNGMQHDGVERYLYNFFSPLVGERCPDCDPIEVNNPFS